MSPVARYMVGSEVGDGVMPAHERLADDIAIVTGAGRNIGKAIATTFAREGAAVVVADLDEQRATAVAAGIEAADGRAMPYPVDVADEAQVETLVAATEDRFGPVDILVNNAAVTERAGLFDLSVEEFDRVMAVNLRGVFLCTREAATSMIDAGGGRIVNVSSATSGHVGRPDAIAYATAKSGIFNFTRSAAKALAEHDIRVNTLSPTRSGSPVGEAETRSGPAAADILVGRWGRPEDQANAALYLVSDESSFVTGTELRVDGGSLA